MSQITTLYNKWLFNSANKFSKIIHTCRQGRFKYSYQHNQQYHQYFTTTMVRPGLTAWPDHPGGGGGGGGHLADFLHCVISTAFFKLLKH